jgi:hypothetical protein
MLLNVKPYGNGQPNTNKEELEMKAQLDTHKAKKIKQFNDTKGKAITHTNVEGEHNEKDNLTFANDDDKINVNILHLCFSYGQKNLSLMTILIYSLEA